MKKFAKSAVAGALMALTAALPALAGDPIRIGFVAERTGAYQGIGIANFDGARLAIDKLNKAGGVTINGEQHMFELVSADSRSDERFASQAAVELIMDEGVQFMFGALGRLAPVVLQLTEANEVIYFTSSSSAAAQIDQTSHMVLTVPPVAVRAELTAKGLTRVFPDAKRLAFLLPQDAVSEELIPRLTEAFTANGVEVVATEMIPAGAADISASLTRVGASDPDVVFTGWVIDQVAPIIRTNTELDAAPRFFSQGFTCDVARTAGIDRPFGANTLVAADLANPSTDVARQLASDFKAFVGNDDPENMFAVMWNYDFFFLLAAGIERAGTYEDTDAVLAAMRDITYDGVAGPIKLDEKNRASYGFDFCKTDGSGGDVEIMHVNPD